MMINSNGVHRKATEEEIAEIELINSTSYDMAKEQKAREKARNLVAEKLGITPEELASLLS
jgi:hypothetical protein